MCATAPIGAHSWFEMSTHSELTALLASLPSAHILAVRSNSYQQGFIDAFIRVHGHREDWLQVLRNSFFVPYSANYTLDRFLQHAAELSVANHVSLRKPKIFGTERKMNPQMNQRDVDVYFELGATRVALEVKCPVEREVPPGQPTLQFSGRHPEAQRMFRELAKVFANANLPEDLKHLELGQHKDNKLKDFLVSAHEKMPVSATLDDLNILLVACGEELQPWYSYLHEREGLFTPASFHPIRKFERVQVVILSNLKYFHTKAAAHHDWTLQNVFLLPMINPRAELNPMQMTVTAGLSVFDHHMSDFRTFHPGALDPNVDATVVRAAKLNTYIHGGLSDTDFQRHFPSTPRRGPRCTSI